MIWSILSTEDGTKVKIKSEIKPPLQHNLPPIDRELLKNHADLLPMYDFSEGISTGTIPDYLLDKRPVPMNNAR